MALFSNTRHLGVPKCDHVDRAGSVQIMFSIFWTLFSSQNKEAYKTADSLLVPCPLREPHMIYMPWSKRRLDLGLPIMVMNLLMEDVRQHFKDSTKGTMTTIKG